MEVRYAVRTLALYSGRHGMPHRLRCDRQPHSISRPEAPMPIPSTTSRPSIYGWQRSKWEAGGNQDKENEAGQSKPPPVSPSWVGLRLGL